MSRSPCHDGEPKAEAGVSSRGERQNGHRDDAYPSDAAEQACDRTGSRGSDPADSDLGRGGSTPPAASPLRPHPLSCRLTEWTIYLSQRCTSDAIGATEGVFGGYHVPANLRSSTPLSRRGTIYQSRFSGGLRRAEWHPNGTGRPCAVYSRTGREQARPAVAVPGGRFVSFRWSHVRTAHLRTGEYRNTVATAEMRAPVKAMSGATLPLPARPVVRAPSRRRTSALIWSDRGRNVTVPFHPESTLGASVIWAACAPDGEWQPVAARRHCPFHLVPGYFRRCLPWDLVAKRRHEQSRRGKQTSSSQDPVAGLESGRPRRGGPRGPGEPRTGQISRDHSRLAMKARGQNSGTSLF